MAFNFQNLTKYVDEQHLPLVSKLGLDAKSAKEFEMMTGVKGETAVNLLNVATTFGQGNVCAAFSDGGEVAFTQRTLNPASLKAEIALCQNAMQDYWMNYQVQVAANKKNLPFEEELTDKIIDSVNSNVERLIWRGVRPANGTINEFDGLATILGANQSGATQLTWSTTSGSEDTAYSATMKVYNAIPAEALSKSTIYMDASMFRELVNELVAKNLYHYVTDVTTEMDIVLPGTSTHVKAMPGLAKKGSDTAQYIIAVVPEHTFYGCDLADDKEQFLMWYSEDNDEYRVRIAFTAGVQVAFPDECVILTK